MTRNRGWRREPARHSLASRGIGTRGIPGKAFKGPPPVKIDPPEDWSEKYLDVFGYISDKIGERQMYGVRSVAVEGPITVMSWSNAAELWLVHSGDYYSKLKAGDSVEVDANEVVLPWGADSEEYRITKELASARMLPALPLFAMSTEAWERGYVDQKKSRLEWAKRQWARIQLEIEREKRL